MKKIILATVCALAFASSAHAGVMNYSNGQGVWQPTQCARPQPPMARTNSETPANQLNHNANGYNDYVQQTNRYMECITQEAKADADLAGKAVLSSLQQEVANAQADVANNRGMIASRRY